MAHVGFHTLRFRWKEQVLATTSLGRGAKLLAICLCDTYVNKKTGQCWPSNRTLAKRMNSSIRTIQRHRTELLRYGWLKSVRIPNVRRGFEISFPSDVLALIEQDKTDASKTTKLSREHDKKGTPYKNQGNNQQREVRETSSLSFLYFEPDGVSEEWRAWISENTGRDFDEVLAWLTIGKRVCLPSRYPAMEKHQSYMEFFKLVISSKGACLKI